MSVTTAQLSPKRYEPQINSASTERIQVRKYSTLEVMEEFVESTKTLQYNNHFYYAKTNPIKSSRENVFLQHSIDLLLKNKWQDRINSSIEYRHFSRANTIDPMNLFWHIYHNTVSGTKYEEIQSNHEDDLVNMLSMMCNNARNEVFEDGMNTEFSIALRRMIKDKGEYAMNALKKILNMSKPNTETMVEILRQLGNINAEKTHSTRLALLEHYLASSDPRIRDAALVGIEHLDDVAAVESLKKAISNEPQGYLRQNMIAVLAQLQDVQ